MELFFYQCKFFGTFNSFIEPVSCKKQQKKSQPRNWFGESRTSEGSEWYQFGPLSAWVTPLIIHDRFGIIQSLLRHPYSQNQFLGWDFFWRFFTAARILSTTLNIGKWICGQCTKLVKWVKILIWVWEKSLGSSLLR